MIASESGVALRSDLTLIGAEVTVQVGGGQIRIRQAGTEVACDNARFGRHERAVDRAHLHGIVPCRPDRTSHIDAAVMPGAVPPGIELLRPLIEYEQVTGGGW